MAAPHIDSRDVRTRSARWDLAYAALALGAVVVGARIVGDLIARSPGISPALGTAASYVVVWVPLVIAVVVACTGLGRGGARRTLGLSFRWTDLVWGLAAGMGARGLDAGLNLVSTGDTGLAPQPTLDGGPDLATSVVLILAPVLVAPLVEEVFFRGLLLRSLDRALTGDTRLLRVLATTSAVIVSAALFAVLHVAVGLNVAPTTATIIVVSTFVFGLIVGTLASVTGRLGGAIVAHVVFNGVAVWATWPA
ncbi:CPBP family intramembrane glutamic endopeptidase [Frigoribacterium sp. CFBP 8751]|uniref:CPBP family intramembrane glutamic endopeptidase n=1 Tax=Frigoribacterium sp. CFBP 8751 TaxID=2775277 RepID=UPI00177AA8ED|nr:CPBP family intramembrane glutamic endopeptidase [Frigoribacterium sp. CFBP 8751]MBD8538918.1 CPBP family intramembrane metalloprotease [Frigoribacterium sp. CFBP 8751]